jgi:hypothetical protein
VQTISLSIQGARFIGLQKQPGFPPTLGNVFTSLRKTIARPASKNTVDQFEEEIICKVIYNFATIHKREPSMATVFEAVKQEEVCLTGKLASF